MRSAPDDRTILARIRDAAIEHFGQRGFGVGVRDLAKEFWRRMIDDVEQYLDDGGQGRHGQAQPRSKGTRPLPGDGQRRFPVLPTDPRGSERLMADSTMYDAFLTQQGNGDDGSDE